MLLTAARTSGFSNTNQGARKLGRSIVTGRRGILHLSKGASGFDPKSLTYGLNQSALSRRQKYSENLVESASPADEYVIKIDGDGWRTKERSKIQRIDMRGDRLRTVDQATVFDSVDVELALQEFSRLLQLPTGSIKTESRTDEKMKTIANISEGVEIKRCTGVHIVDTREKAAAVMYELMSHTEPYYAVDTEVADIDVKSSGPVDNGYVTCISIYGGPDLDLGGGKGKTVWVDNLDAAEGLLEEFRPFLESKKHKKVWHNYGFDRHVLFNVPPYSGGQRIDCKGFAGDTMHMARLWDTSMEKSTGKGGFSLENLSATLLADESSQKTSMKTLFGVPNKRQDGSDGSILTLPAVEELQRGEATRRGFIEYSAKDASATWEIREVLEAKLRAMEWASPTGTRSMWEFYTAYYVPFGELLTDMEREGVYVKAGGYLAQVEVQARKDQKQALDHFLNWVRSVQPEAAEINPSSTVQIQALLFGGAQVHAAKGRKVAEPIPAEKVFKVEKSTEELARESATLDRFALMKTAELKAECERAGLRKTGTKAQLAARLRGEEPPDFAAEFRRMKAESLRHVCVARNLSNEGKKADLVSRLVADSEYQYELMHGAAPPSPPAQPAARVSRHKDLVIRGLGMQPVKYTASGTPAVSMDVLRKLAGDLKEEPPKYGPAYEHFGGGRAGAAACAALDALCNVGSIDTMISTFLVPLQTLVDDRSRIHCSLNINTETGRLSSRRPNLQNQPALEKDQYRIRSAFQAEPGKKLIVADYGQLELRLLAHITRCRSMLEAFERGGCFHSRTAMGMFDHVKKAVDAGEVYLEWDYSKGKPDKPLVKDQFASERRKAKTLNFSIAYGKTSHGLSKDWGVSVEDANELLQAWYADRPEVKKWQEDTKAAARKSGYTRTLMGRYRRLGNINSSNRSLRSHSERASINTPIQGGAADIAMMAMIKIARSERLKQMDWKLLLQVHDEVILEGPEGSVEEALSEVVHCMEEPWDSFGLEPLLVNLAVDAKYADTWYDAK